jgi:predicted DNA-binding antitoxin AbrB/MazE fold protein
MSQTVEAIYEHGALRLLNHLPDLKEGQRVRLILETIAEPAPEEAQQLETAFLDRMRAEGRILNLPAPAQPPPPDWRPLVISGEPLSETILKMRGERG